MSEETRTMIFRGHSSIGIKYSSQATLDSLNSLDTITLEQYEDLTTFTLPEGFNFITIHKYNCPVYSNTTEYFLLWGLTGATVREDLLSLHKIKDGAERKKKKNEIMKDMVKNFLIKVLNKVDNDKKINFIEALTPYLNYDTAELIWNVRQETLAKLSPKTKISQPSPGMTVLSSSKKAQPSSGMTVLSSSKKAQPSSPDRKTFESTDVTKKPVVNVWKDTKRMQLFQVNHAHNYITDEIINRVNLDLNFTINTYNPGDKVPILFLENELHHDYSDKRNYYYHGFFDLSTYLNLKEPMLESSTVPIEIQQNENLKDEIQNLTNLRENIRMKSLDDYLDKRSKRSKDGIANLSKDDELRINKLSGDIDKKKIRIAKNEIKINEYKQKGLSQYNIDHNLPKDMKIDLCPIPLPILDFFQSNDYQNYYNLIKFIEDCFKNYSFSSHSVISDDFITYNKVNFIGEEIFTEIKDLLRSDPTTAIANLNEILIIKMIKNYLNFEFITHINFKDFLIDLEWAFEWIYSGNFFERMPSGTYIFASCGSLDKVAEKLFDKLSEEDRTNGLFQIKQTQQEKSYSKKYMIKY